VTPHFDLTWAIVAAAVFPLLAAAMFRIWHRRRLTRLARLGGEAAITRLAPATARQAPVWRALRVSSAVALATLAFAGPRWGSGTSVVRTEGIDVVLAMDVSLSMLARDDRPSRLERLKQEVRRFRASAPGDRVALLAFAGRSYILTPLTADDGAIDLFIDNLDPSVVGQAGTAMAPAIKQGVDLLRAAKGAASHALVILSDGEAFDDRAEALAAARQARDAEVAVVTVGFGTEGGSTIPVREGGAEKEKRDDAGQVVITRYDPTLLREVAQAAGGEFIAATVTDRGARIHSALARLDAKQRDLEEGLSRPLRITWFLLPAALLLLLDAWLVDGGSLARLRRRLRLAPAAALLAILPARAHAQDADAAMKNFRAGRFLTAAQQWRRQIAEGDKRPATLYNLGTALLAADSLEMAMEALERAALSVDPETRRRALFNLGLVQLRRGGKLDGDDARRALGAALSAYRALLLQRPDDRDAKWNYELALQQQRRNAGGGQSDQPKQQQQQQQPQAPQQDQSRSMTRQQAEQLLAAAARDERETQAKRQRGQRVEKPPGGKDW
jgi:Ca-activated chloride channel family protein